MLFDRLKNILSSEVTDFLDNRKKNNGTAGSPQRKKTADEIINEFETSKPLHEDDFDREFQRVMSGQPSADLSPEDKKNYQVLEIPYGSAFPEIKKAYKSLIKKYHPDLFASDPEKFKASQQLAMQLNDAYSYFEKKFGK